MKTKLFCAVIILLSLGVPHWTAAAIVPCEFELTGGQPLTEGPYEGLYKYELYVDWSLDKGLSHVDLVLPECLDSVEAAFAFEDPAGFSTGEYSNAPEAVSWLGELEGGDPSIDLEGALIKFEPVESEDEPGRTGSGYFWFYSDAEPRQMTSRARVAVKFGQSDGFGLTENHLPEPATVALLSIGGMVIFSCGRKGRCVRKG